MSPIQVPIAGREYHQLLQSLPMSMTISSSSRLAYISSSITRKRYILSETDLSHTHIHNYTCINRCLMNSGTYWLSACLFTKRTTKCFQQEFLYIVMAFQRQVLVSLGGSPPHRQCRAKLIQFSKRSLLKFPRHLKGWVQKPMDWHIDHLWWLSSVGVYSASCSADSGMWCFSCPRKQHHARYIIAFFS